MTAPTRASFFAPRPLFWAVFAVVLLGIPLAMLIRESRMTFAELLPTVNASLNATSGICLFAGWRAIKGKHVSLHWKLMTAALVASSLFLVCYLIRFALTGAHRYPLEDWTRPVYLTILASHTLLAAFVPFLAARTLHLALKKKYESHRRIARWTFPIWAYVSVTGVIVYFMLYHLPHWVA